MNIEQEVPHIDLLALLLESQSDQEKLELFEKTNDQIGLLHFLKNEVDKYVNIDGAKALSIAQLAFGLGQLLADPASLALGHWSLARGLTMQGQYQEALPHFDTARRKFREAGQETNVHRVAIRELQALAITGDFEAALNLAKVAREGFEANGLDDEAAKVANNIGIIQIRLGQYHEAIETLKEAITFHESLEDVSGLALAEINLGQAYQYIDQFQQALTYLESAARRFEELGQTYNLAGTLVETALLHRREGRLALVLDILSRARVLFEKLENHADAAFAQLEEARIHFDLNLLTEAETLARAAMEVFSQHQMPLEALEAQTVLGMTLVKTHEYSEATEVLLSAKEDWKKLGNNNQAAWTDVYLATLFLEQEGQTKKAEGHLNSATSSFKETGSRAGQTIAQILLAQVFMQVEEHDKAEACLLQAEELASALGIPDLIIRSTRLLGQLANKQDDMPTAERYFLQAIDELEGVRASLNVDEFKAAYFGEKLDVYIDLISLLIRQQRFEFAFHYVERSKSRALLDLIGKGVELPTDESDEDIAALQTELQEARSSLNWHYLKAEKEGPESLIWEKVREIENQVTSLLRDIERLTPQAAALEQVAVPDLPSIQSHLDEQTLILEYFALGDRLLAFVLNKQGIRCIQGLASLTEVSQALERLNFTMSRVAQGQMYEQIYGKDMLQMRTDKALKSLYDLLIQPLDIDLKGQYLVIVPYGVLHKVPFAALYDGQTYLSDQALISLIPSTAVYLHCKAQDRQARGQVTAFGVPFEDIPSVREEVEAVSSIFNDTQMLIGKDASLARFHQEAPQANVLHIATHGIYRPDNPMFSGLRFHDGWLAARDLYHLKLKASLVVLSACETGLSQAQSSDELFGLARGFFFAGSPCMIVSLWAVKDSPTSQLMIKFYSGLQQGLSVAKALQLARQFVRKQYPNPYYWSAFNILGDSKRTIMSLA